ncbi:DUF418 domain-containing protein [Mycetocola sp.]|uniref:DUF418 domain-containing protein n=1 Tax=Mycetocola sp. TaxID=1871042 RepID=UPI0039899E2C
MDIARGLAILGMFVAHTIPRTDDGELLVDGRSSILFATLAGVSLGLLSGGTEPPGPGERSAIRRVVLVRALFVFLLGVLLATLGSEIAIILDYYAIMFLALLPLLFARRAVLTGTAVLLLIAAPMLARLVDPGNRAPASILDVGWEYLLTGYYPALVWLPLLLLGLVAARSGLDRRRTQVWMAGAGSAAAIAGYGSALVLPGVTAEAHSSTTAEILGSGGTAFAVIGLLLLVTTAGGLGEGVSAVLWPLGAAGALALTVYTAQIVVLAMVAGARDSGGPDYPGWPLLIGLAVASLLGASAWRYFLGRGPLERLVTALAGRR